MSEHELWNELGNLYFMSGAYDQAIYAYNRSIELDGLFGRPYSNLALTYVQKGKYTDAVELYRRSIELLNDVKEKAISWNRLGDLYRQLKVYDEAVEAYQQADQLDHSKGEPSDELVELNINEYPMEPEGPAESNEVSLQAEPESGEAFINTSFEESEWIPYPTEEIASWASDETEPDEAIVSELLESGIETTSDEMVLDEFSFESNLMVRDWLPQPVEVHAQMRDLSNHEKMEAATSSYANLPLVDHITTETDVTKNSFILGTSSEAPLEPALEVIEDSLTELMEEENEAVLEGVEDSLTEPMEAENETEAVLEAIEDSLTESVETGNETEEASEDVYEAEPTIEDKTHYADIEMNIARFKKILQINPRNSIAWDTLGGLYKSIGCYKEALVAFQRAISIDSAKSLYHHHLGLVYAAEGRVEDAIEAFQKVIELDPEHGLAHATLGGYYKKMGLEELAQTHIGKAMKLIYDSENEYNRACLEAICGNVDKALDLLKIALESKQTYIDWILRDPDLDFIRSDPRFKALVADFSMSRARQ